MQQHDFETQIPRARVLTEDELLQAQGGSFIEAVRGVFVDPLPKGLRALWNQVRNMVREIS